MRITKREILFSIIVIFLMASTGMLIHSVIQESITKDSEKIFMAAKIEEPDMFNYSLQTSIGNALVYGTITAAEPVSLPEIKGEYFSITRVTERYTKHIETETYTDSSGKTKTREVVKYSWDYYGRDNYCSGSFYLMGNRFDNKIEGLPGERIYNLKEVVSDEWKNDVHDGYIYKDGYLFENVGDKREYYIVTSMEMDGTLEVNLVDNSIKNFYGGENIKFHYNKSIEETVEEAKNRGTISTIAFVSIWPILTLAAVIEFYYIDNRWLEG